MDDDKVAAVLKRYRAAFEAATGAPAPGISIKPRGWFKVEGRGPLRRLAEFDEWSERLEKRAALVTTPSKL